MNRMSFRVSGSRVGDEVRPVAEKRDILPRPARSKQVGMRVIVDRPLVVPTAPAFGPEDYATADEYE